MISKGDALGTPLSMSSKVDGQGYPPSIRGGSYLPLPGHPLGQVVVYATIVNSDSTVVIKAVALADPVTVDDMEVNNWGETDRPFFVAILLGGSCRERC